MYNIIRKLLILSILLLSACTSKPIKYSIDYAQEVADLNSQQVIEWYIQEWNNKDFEKMGAVLSGDMAGRTINYTSVKSIEIMDIQEIYTSNLPITVENLKEIKVYKVLLDIVYKEKERKDNEDEELYYYVGKKDESSPWILYDVSEIK